MFLSAEVGAAIAPKAALVKLLKASTLISAPFSGLVQLLPRPGSNKPLEDTPSRAVANVAAELLFQGAWTLLFRKPLVAVAWEFVFSLDTPV